MNKWNHEHKSWDFFNLFYCLFCTFNNIFVLLWALISDVKLMNLWNKQSSKGIIIILRYNWKPSKKSHSLINKKIREFRLKKTWEILLFQLSVMIFMDGPQGDLNHRTIWYQKFFSALSETHFCLQIKIFFNSEYFLNFRFLFD